MIELINVTKYFPTASGRHYLYRNVSLVLPPNKNIGVIGPNGAGKSTFLRLLSGADLPSEGRVIRTGKISWPLGLTPGLQTDMTGTENTRFAARIYGMSKSDIKKTIETVREVAEIGKYFDMPVRTYSAGMKQRVAFALSMSLDFDYYLFDEIGAGGDAKFRIKANAMIEARLSRANFIVVTHNHKEIVELCQAAILIGDGKLTFYDSVNEAVEVYNQVYGKAETGLGRKAAARREAIAAIRQGLANKSGHDESDRSGALRERVTPLPLAPRIPPEAAPNSEVAPARAEKAAAIASRRAKIEDARLERGELQRQSAEKRAASKAEAEMRAQEKAADLAKQAAQREQAQQDAKLLSEQLRREREKQRAGLKEKVAEARLKTQQRLALRKSRQEKIAAAKLKTAQRLAQREHLLEKSAEAKPKAEQRSKRGDARPAGREAAPGAPANQSKPRLVNLRQTISALSDQLKADGQPVAELRRIRQELHTSRLQLKELAATKRLPLQKSPAGTIAHAPGSDSPTADSKQSDE